ncbi:type II secretion system F family protein [Fenollaria massiliensis]|uniref:Type II secretion system F family protein n=1 Tax=Fenollaria massiliensis TaxID=938288 RepID=A0A9E7DKJ4_9FIRM|nr:type II secretion system F family protein [Fenollaria massiliensis]UQK59759.1 type II secretion system F family protein [Fenollaria massiliensis]
MKSSKKATSMKFEIIFENNKSESISAKNIYEAFQKSKEKEIDFMDVKYFRPAKIYRIFKINNVSKKHIANFFRIIAFNLKISNNLPQILEQMYQNSSALSDPLKNYYPLIKELIEHGFTLSEILAKLDILDNLSLLSLRIAEKSEHIKSSKNSKDLSEQILEISENLYEQEEYKNTINNIMIKPKFLMAALLAFIIMIIVFLVPQFSYLFDNDMNLMPDSLKLLLIVSNSIKYNYIYYILGIIILFIAFAILNKNDGYLYVKQRYLLESKNGLYKTRINYRILYYMLSMLRSGSKINEIFDFFSKNFDLIYLRKEFERMTKMLNEGETLHNVLDSSHIFLDDVKTILITGYEAENLAEIIENVLSLYKRDLKRRLDKFVNSIEPIMTIIMGLVIMLILLMVFKPMYDSMTSIIS